MNRVSALGAAALLAVGMGVVPAAALVGANGGAATSSAVAGEVCPAEGRVEVRGGSISIPVVAPEGTVITGYCVKAGSEQSGAGVHYVEFEPPVHEATISHPSGKEISHYAPFLAPTPAPSPTPSPSPSPSRTS